MAIVLSSTGQITKPDTPAFSASDARGGNWSDNGEYSRFFNSVHYNVGNCYNSTTGRFTAPVAGTYLFGYNLFTTSSYGSASRSGIGVNGLNNLSMGESVAVASGTHTIIYYLNAGDFVSLVTQNSAYYAHWYGANQHSRFWGYLLG